MATAGGLDNRAILLPSRNITESITVSTMWNGGKESIRPRTPLPHMRAGSYGVEFTRSAIPNVTGMFPTRNQRMNGRKRREI